MELVNEALLWLQAAGFVLIGVWASVRWRRRGDEQSRWLAATFAVLATVVVLAVVLDALGAQARPEALERGVVAVLVPFPYLLVRFLATFEDVPRSVRRVLGWVVASLAVAALVLPDWPGPDDARGTGFQVFALLVVAAWVVALPWVAVRFWRAGRSRPTLARRRLRVLAVALVGLSLAVVLAGLVAEPGELTLLGSRAVALAAAGLFLVGFTPPPSLRRLWRQPEEEQLHRAALGLMRATTEQEVAEVLVPHLRAVVAARGLALVRAGRLLGWDGAVPTGPDGFKSTSDARTVELSEGAIHVWTDRYTPFFGDEELALLERLGLLADLALDRVALLTRQEESRAALEHANNDLESFVYSASHDLKSPLIALLSYVEILDEDVRETLDDDGRWYLDRITANGRYMEALIRDLLELSRVGRAQTTTDRVDLGELVAGVADEVRAQRPQLRVEVEQLPTLSMNAVRARQLFTNLLENAATHADGAPVVVTVTSRPADDGGVVVSVRDDGPGVPADYRERVFGVFERLGSDERHGTGIGLAICRKIMDSVAGRIWLADTDRGADFRLRFPATAVAPPGDTVPEHDPQPPSDSHNEEVHA